MILRFILSSLLFLSIFSLWAQEKEKKETPKIKKEKMKIQLNGIRLTTDISGILLTVLDGNRMRYEVGAEVNISNAFFFNADYGISNMTSKLNVRMPYSYENKGTYMRFGLDYNLLHKILDKQAVFVGVRYGLSNFEHKLIYFTFDGYWPVSSPLLPITESNMNLQWAEGVLGIRTNMYRGLMAGFTIRYQMMTNIKDGDLVSATDVPGFGRTERPSHIIMNYNIIYEYSFKKRK